MPLPLIPLLIGAAIGAAVTYIITNRDSQNRLTNAAQDVGDSVQAGADKLKRVVSDTVDDASSAVKDVASKVID